MLGKVKEAFAALKLEKQASKEEILETYLNTISYANQAQGIEAASRIYFGCPAKELSLAQAALLAGIPKSPARYDPFANKKEALARQKSILERMLKDGWISEESHHIAGAEKISLQKAPREFSAPHFTQYVLGLAGPGGSTLKTTLDASLQKDLGIMLRSHLEHIAGHHVANGALLVLDNRRGEVLAWVGSQDYFDAQAQGQVDGVLAKRQPGSSIKAFLYALAFSRGLRPSDLILDEPNVAPGNYRPLNYDRSYHGSVSARQALACSYNIPAVKVCERVGYPAFYRKLRDFGMLSLDRGADFYGLGLALGNGDLSLLELANGYAALAREGWWMPLKVLRDKDLPLALEGRPHRALEPGACYLALDVLSDNAARVAAFGRDSPLNLPFPLAAKTGTTKDYRDNWCVGVTPEWTVAVWVGNFDGTPMRHVSGITGAAPLMRDAALRVRKDYPSSAFSAPRGVKRLEACADSGASAGPQCRRQVEEVYLDWRLPPAECPLHRPGAAAGTRPPSALKIHFPRQGEILKWDPSAPHDSQKLRFASSWDDDGRPLAWSVDGVEIPMERGEAWWQMEPGEHEVRVRALDGGGGTRTARGKFRVLR
jgi:penicillin-binding protein 1C